MDFISVKECAKILNKSERTIRSYCADGKFQGAFLTGKTWNIPIDAIANQKNNNEIIENELLQKLKFEKDNGIKGGIYHKLQIIMTYNSNHIEGSKLTEDQTRYIFETNTIGVDEPVNIDDIIETSNHFKCIDYIIDNSNSPLSEILIKKLHSLLKCNTSDSQKDWFNVGEYKKLPNEVGGNETTLPENVERDMNNLLEKYNQLVNVSLEDIIEFHKDFESIHPFQDGNGRIGRLVMLKECLKNNIVPFVITDQLKYYYYRGLKEWKNEKGFLIDTCLTAQDQFKKYLDYFKINY